MSAPKLLLVEDDTALAELVEYRFRGEGYDVRTTDDGDEALLLAAEDTPDLVLLDWMIGGTSGIEVCRRLRRQKATAHVPIIMLTARSDEDDRVRGLETGADDYVTKPFSLGEIMARIKARLRRQDVIVEQQKNEAISIAEITIDPSRGRLVVRGNEVALAPKEFRLLHLLMENRGRIVTRQILLEKVWGYDFEGEHQTISVHIRWLREKIEIDPNNPRHIATVRSRGYMFRE